MNAVSTVRLHEMGHFVEHVRRFLKWDRSMDLANHLTVTATTCLEVCFAYSRSPSQLGASMNANGPARLCLSIETLIGSPMQADLDEVAATLTEGPRGPSASTHRVVVITPNRIDWWSLSSC
jgi:IS30 family transposase